MTKHFPILGLIVVLFASCMSHKNPPVPDTVPAEGKLGDARGVKDSKVSAALEAAEYSASQYAPGPVRDATIGVIRVGRSWAGPATDADRAEFMKLVNLALKGKLDEAQAGWDKSKTEAAQKEKEIADLKAERDKQLKDAAAQWQTKLDNAKSEAKKARDRIMYGILFGLGALGVIGGAVVFFMGAQFAAIYPALGPKAGMAVGGAGLILIATGVAANSIESLFERHPWVLATGCGSAILLVSIAMALMYANHHHATKS